METIALQHILNGSAWQLHSQPQVVVLGHFDGLHTGHIHVIERGLAYSQEHNIPLGVMTFHPHPKYVFGRQGYERYLTPLAEKERQLAKLGVDFMYVVNFDLEFARISPQQFVEALCKLKAQHVVCGFDYRFGFQGVGTAESLREIGKDCFTVDIVEPFDDKGQKVSSTRIRACLDDGDMVQANHLLGRPYTITGTVVHGEKRGRTIGFPTANVDPAEPYYIPRLGVYAVRVQVRGEMYDGVLSIGLKPTFHSHILAPIVEAHLFDFDADIYDETLTVSLIAYLRSEKKFNGIQELIEQITRDAEDARAVLRG
ncbi:bifunctional riboflavin kinase/FAD synthetase [Paenibacillus arenosi]|uniref:Riboflavin biosynthesis protein n=1 Tax=Paenibacillus arenosi TaxID=2774142 RepID=A0ABR9ASL6_9BACL|nr:bifunctional riboflavin kinase/FAD synthetase [Paenibacillus arenosi]MBD8497110.1 bifunctional riboflavin kinase/FAD synthetase [Paenibacillus arenosi]